MASDISKIKSDLNFKNKSKVLTFITAAALMIVVIILIGSNIGGSSIRILSVSLLAIGILVVVLSYLELRE